jgi:SET domain-containing protein
MPRNVSARPTSSRKRTSPGKRLRRSFRIGRARTGLGLFAVAPIEKRELIAEYRGRRLRNAEAEKLEARGNRYLYEINSRWTIDGTSRANLARYANHSCRPNAESHRIGRKVFIRAIKRIRPGDEITYDYGRDYFRNVITPRGCKCDKCRERRRGARRERERRKARRAARAGMPQRRRKATGARGKAFSRRR